MLNVLKGMLSEELYSQVDEALKGKDLEKYVPKARFDEVIAERDNARTKAEGFKDYDEIKAKLESYADYEDLKDKASKLENYKDYDILKEKASKLEEVTLNNKKLKLKSMGIDEGFIDYALTKIDGEDFDEGAKQFIEANPKFKSETFQKIDSSFSLAGGGKIDMSKLSSEEYIEARKTHDVDGNPITKK